MSSQPLTRKDESISSSNNDVTSTNTNNDKDEKLEKLENENHVEVSKSMNLTDQEREDRKAHESLGNRLENPLYGLSSERLIQMGSSFSSEKGLGDSEIFSKAALVASDPLGFESLELLDEEDKIVLRREATNRWDQPRALYFLVIVCSVAAAVQGMDESVTNGANGLWAPQFGLDTTSGSPNASQNQWLLGLVAGAPYLACFVLGCWLTSPLNFWFGRRGTIFITATVSALACIWSSFTNSWPHLFAARFVLGLGIGAKSATVPMYGAETAPPLIRGALVMQWQVWTAFGIMLGTASSLIFLNVESSHIEGLNWRLMLGSAALPAFVVMSQVYFCPESPRWLIGKGRYSDAYASLCRLRHTKLQAARDLFLIHSLLQEENAIGETRSAFVQLFVVPRNRRAALASGIVMFMQQFCGINVNAYYSSTVFREAGLAETPALLATLGFGIINFVFAAPAVWTIDTFGRRNLLLVTFPLMSLFLLLTGFAFLIPKGNAHLGIVALGIYLHDIVYSFGEGPVPFTYSAEAFPLHVRDLGMSYATAVTWGFNFIVALTFPRLLDAFTPTGAYGWYAAWCIVGTILILLFVPETKALTLEELDQVFSVPTGKHASYQIRQLPYNIRRYFFRQKLGPKEKLYGWESSSSSAENLNEKNSTGDA